MTFALAIVAGLFYWLGNMKMGYSLHNALRQPIVMALPFGLIAGDLPTALVIGASIEMMYIGIVGAGSNIPADESLAGAIAIPLALMTKMDVGQAVTVAVPIALLGALMNNLRMMIHVVLVHRADKCAEQLDFKGLQRCAITYPLGIGFVLRFPVAFLAVLLGSSVVEAFFNAIPTWLSHGLTVAGGVLPGLGFAMTLYIIGKDKFLPFFILGFFIVQYLGINTMAAAIFGICMVLIIMILRNDKRKLSV